MEGGLGPGGTGARAASKNELDLAIAKSELAAAEKFASKAELGALGHRVDELSRTRPTLAEVANIARSESTKTEKEGTDTRSYLLRVAAFILSLATFWVVARGGKVP